MWGKDTGTSDGSGWWRRAPSPSPPPHLPLPQLPPAPPPRAPPHRPLLPPLPLASSGGTINIGGGGGDGDLFSGGGGGGEDEGGDGDADAGGDDASVNRREALFVLAQLGRKLESLPADLGAAVDGGRVPGEIVQRFADLEKSAMFWWLLQFGGFKERLLADDLFLIKVAMECDVGIFTKERLEVNKETDKFSVARDPANYTKRNRHVDVLPCPCCEGPGACSPPKSCKADVNSSAGSSIVEGARKVGLKVVMMNPGFVYEPYSPRESISFWKRSYIHTGALLGDICVFWHFSGKVIEQYQAIHYSLQCVVAHLYRMLDMGALTAGTWSQIKLFLGRRLVAAISGETSTMHCVSIVGFSNPFIHGLLSYWGCLYRLIEKSIMLCCIVLSPFCGIHFCYMLILTWRFACKPCLEHRNCVEPIKIHIHSNGPSCLCCKLSAYTFVIVNSWDICWVVPQTRRRIRVESLRKLT